MSKPFHPILLVDDDTEDLEALYEALQLVGSPYEIAEAHNGEEALTQLKKMKAMGSIPSLVVMDINMPKVDGKQTLVAIQSDEELCSIPVVIFSTSSSPLDKLFFAKRHVELITKPFDLNSLTEVAGKLLSYCKHYD